MAAYRQVYDSRHVQANCQVPGSTPEPYARQSSMGYLYLLVITSAYGSRPVLVSRASRSALRPPLNINALRVNLVNVDIVDYHTTLSSSNFVAL